MSFDIPDACTLTTVDRPLRLAEFDELFAAVRDVEILAPTHARMRLSGPAGLEERVRDLAARETGCCSFFDFTVTPARSADDVAVVLDVEVPVAYADVLASLAQRATAVSTRATL